MPPPAVWSSDDSPRTMFARMAAGFIAAKASRPGSPVVSDAAPVSGSDGGRSQHPPRHADPGGSRGGGPGDGGHDRGTDRLGPACVNHEAATAFVSARQMMLGRGCDGGGRTSHGERRHAPRPLASPRLSAAPLGPLDVPVNNAGTCDALGPVSEVDPDAWWRDVEVSLRRSFLCARAVLPGMLACRCRKGYSLPAPARRTGTSTGTLIARLIRQPSAASCSRES